ncbi:lysine--tRNA ligase [Candidatus Omnitrophota bacterium]
MEEIINQRVNKIKALQEKGFSPYGARFERTAEIADVLADFQEDRSVSLAGRVMAQRAHGKVTFLDIHDRSGKIQVYVKEKEISEKSLEIFKQLDIGDFIGVQGKLFKTRTQEMSVAASELVPLSKALRPLPEKWHGLKDVETRYRRRYLDLIASDEVKEIFKLRSKTIKGIRDFFDTRGYLEVETPMLQTIPGGATGRPFKSHHNSFDMDVYLRIAPELYLKRLLVGGFDKVYELNRSFRNEGISTRHNPEFTMFEVYTAYADYQDMMNLTEELIAQLAKDITGSLKIQYQGNEIDLTPPWRRCSFADVVKEQFDILPDDNAEAMLAKIKKKKPNVIEKKTLSRSQIMKIIEDFLQDTDVSKPTFFTDYFSFLSPLAKTKKDNPLIAERFELFVGGMEVANAYSELNDPQEQRKRFQEALKDLDRELVQKIDDDFITALEYGMPPAGGLGIGIDRLVMLFANQPSIREVILFPLLRPEEKDDE